MAMMKDEESCNSDIEITTIKYQIITAVTKFLSNSYIQNKKLIKISV